MSEQGHRLVSPLQSPTTSDPEVWKAYWKAQNQPWRTELEIGDQRQKELAQHRTIVPDIKQGIYPFKNTNLSRADIEWLLATHENGRGPIDWKDVNQRERRGLDLRGADLRHVDLRGLPLARIRGSLDRSEWFNANSNQKEMAAVLLDGANLRNAHLEECELLGAHLEKTILTEASLMQAILLEAVLNGSALRGAHLENADLRGAHLERVRLDGSQMNKADLSEANLAEANLYATQLEDASFYKAHLERAFLQEAYLEGADFDQADLRYANIKKACLKRASFCFAHLEDADLEDACLEQANLQGAFLEQTNLKKAHAEAANFTAAHLKRAILREAHLERAEIKGARLEHADLYRTHLERANLRGAHLERAVLIETYLEDADLREVHLEGSSLKETHLQGAKLCEAFFNEETQLINIALGEKPPTSASLADIHWGDTNLAVVNWASVKILGDESEVYRHKKANKIAVLYYYQRAVRANRQLSIVLQEQGLNEDAARFAYRAQKLQRVVLRIQKKIGSYLFSEFLDILAGYGYHPAKTIFWYLFVICGFAAVYAAYGHLSTFPDALVFSFMSFHGRGFFPSLSSETNLHNPLVVLAAAEAVAGLFIEISFVATFTQRFLGR